MPAVPRKGAPETRPILASPEPVGWAVRLIGLTEWVQASERYYIACGENQAYETCRLYTEPTANREPVEFEGEFTGSAILDELVEAAVQYGEHGGTGRFGRVTGLGLKIRELMTEPTPNSAAQGLTERKVWFSEKDAEIRALREALEKAGVRFCQYCYVLQSGLASRCSGTPYVGGYHDFTTEEERNTPTAARTALAKGASGD